MRRAKLRGVLATATGVVAATLAAGLIAPVNAAAAPVVSAKFLSTTNLPFDWIPAPARFGGISGIDGDGRGNYSVITDDTGANGPTRYYDVSVPLNRDGMSVGAPALVGGGVVLGPNNIPMLPGSGYEFEAIRHYGDSLIVASDGPEPFIRMVSAPGLHQRDFALPAAYVPKKGSGLRGHLGLESLAVSEGGLISTITENSLAQDGPRPSLAAGTSSRLLQLRGNGSVSGEFVYRTDPLAPGSSGRAFKGVSEVLAVNKTDFLVLERGYDPARNSYDIKVFWTTTNGADRVTGKAALAGSEKAMPKHLVYNLSSLTNLRPGNVEGLAWGPRLSNNRRALLAVSDNGFNSPAVPNKLHVMAVQFPG